MKDFMSGSSGCEYFLSKNNGFLDEAFGNEWKIVREPGVDPAFERANPGDSFGPQQQRHPGAGRFVGSSTQHRQHIGFRYICSCRIAHGMIGMQAN